MAMAALPGKEDAHPRAGRSTMRFALSASATATLALPDGTMSLQAIRVTSEAATAYAFSFRMVAGSHGFNEPEFYKAYSEMVAKLTTYLETKKSISIGATVRDEYHRVTSWVFQILDVPENSIISTRLDMLHVEATVKYYCDLSVEGLGREIERQYQIFRKRVAERVDEFTNQHAQAVIEYTLCRFIQDYFTQVLKPIALSMSFKLIYNRESNAWQKRAFTLGEAFNAQKEGQRLLIKSAKLIALIKAYLGEMTPESRWRASSRYMIPRYSKRGEDITRQRRGLSAASQAGEMAAALLQGTDVEPLTVSTELHDLLSGHMVTVSGTVGDALDALLRTINAMISELEIAVATEIKPIDTGAPKMSAEGVGGGGGNFTTPDRPARQGDVSLSELDPDFRDSAAKGYTPPPVAGAFSATPHVDHTEDQEALPR